MVRKKKVQFIIGVVVVFLICLCVNWINDSVLTATIGSTSVLRWGLKRNGNGKAPDIDPGSGELLKQYNALHLGNPELKKVYLTFDEGYENGYTDEILDVLKENKVKAIFFITGPYLDKESELVRRMVEEGHEVGNHTVNHPSLPQCSKEKMEKEVLDLEREFKAKFNKNMRFLRPPKGEYSKDELAVTNSISYINLFWSLAYADWDVNKQKGADYAYKMVTENLHSGAVILLHAVSVDNAKALDRIIKETINQGYTFGTPDELATYALNQSTKASPEAVASPAATKDNKTNETN